VHGELRNSVYCFTSLVLSWLWYLLA
jgi:hypothetical protein